MFHAAVPQCKIESDGRVIEPTAAHLTAAVVDANRRAAEWVVSLGGAFRLVGESSDRTSMSDLPNEFTLYVVKLDGKQVPNEGLKHLSGLRNLIELSLAGTHRVGRGAGECEANQKSEGPLAAGCQKCDGRCHGAPQGAYGPRAPSVFPTRPSRTRD